MAEITFISTNSIPVYLSGTATDSSIISMTEVEKTSTVCLLHPDFCVLTLTRHWSQCSVHFNYLMLTTILRRYLYLRIMKYSKKNPTAIYFIVNSPDLTLLY